MFLFSKSKLKVVWVAASLYVSAMIVIQSTAYFSAGPTPLFILEKGSIGEHPLWLTAFRFHVFSSCVCLITGPLLMIPRLIKYHRLHMILGYTYINTVLWIAAPTGLLISMVAKGGVVSAAGFLVTGIAWLISTWLGYTTIVKHELQSHICWMVRSYSIALSAVWFRLIQQAMSFRFDNQTSYVSAVWLSLLVSIWFSESCIAAHFRLKKQGKPFATTLKFVNSNPG